MVAPRDGETLAEEWAKAWNAHDVEAVTGWYAADASHRMASGNTYTGAAAIRDMASRTLTAYPDLAFTVRGAFAADDHFAIEYTMRGTQQVAVHDRPGTGKTIIIDGALVGAVDDEGRVATCVDYLDHHDVRRQLGLVPDA